jgi:hypothetical protein
VSSGSIDGPRPNEVIEPMRATFNQVNPTAGGPIAGTFYPDAGPPHGAYSVIPRIVAVVAALMFLRVLGKVARHHGPGTGPGSSGRMARLAELHRRLHAEDERPAASGEGVTA